MGPAIAGTVLISMKADLYSNGYGTGTYET